MIKKKYVTDYYIDQLYQKYYESKGPKIAFDTETTGLDWFNKARIFSFSFTNNKLKTVVKRIDRRDGAHGLEIAKRKAYIKEKLSNKNNILISHNSIFDIGMCVYSGYKISRKTIIHDTMRIHQLLRNDYHSHRIKDLGYIYFDYTKKYDDLVDKYKKIYGSYQDIPNEIMGRYQYADSYRCMLLFKLLWPELKKNEQLLRIYINEMLMIWVCLTIQKTGLKINPSKAESLLDWLEKKKEKSVYRIKNKAGVFLDVHKQGIIQHILQNLLDIKLTKKTAKGSICVDKEVLHDVRKKYIIDNKKNPKKYTIINDIIKIKSYTRGITDVTKYIELTDNNNIIHSTQKPNTAKTGRQGTENPNLLNVSKSKPTEERPFPIPARSIFYPLDNHTIYLVDYDAQEMLLITALSKDINMIKAVNKGLDPHTEAAKLFFGSLFTKCKDKEKYALLRGYAKTVHFAMAYGANIETLFQKFQIFSKISEAKNALDRYEKVFPRIRNFSKSQIKIVKRCGRLETPFGRQLLVNPEKAFTGANHIIQATGSDILKFSEVRLDKYFKNEWDNKIKIMLAIHDELILAVHESINAKSHTWCPAISTIMTSFSVLDVKLKVSWSVVTKSWDDKIKWQQ